MFIYLLWILQRVYKQLDNQVANTGSICESRRSSSDVDDSEIVIGEHVCIFLMSC